MKYICKNNGFPSRAEARLVRRHTGGANRYSGAEGNELVLRAVPQGFGSFVYAVWCGLR